MDFPLLYAQELLVEEGGSLLLAIDPLHRLLGFYQNGDKLFYDLVVPPNSASNFSARFIDDGPAFIFDNWESLVQPVFWKEQGAIILPSANRVQKALPKSLRQRTPL